MIIKEGLSDSNREKESEKAVGIKTQRERERIGERN